MNCGSGESVVSGSAVVRKKSGVVCDRMLAGGQVQRHSAFGSGGDEVYGLKCREAFLSSSSRPQTEIRDAFRVARHPG
jgi:hypothetical protein